MRRTTVTAILMAAALALTACGNGSPAAADAPGDDDNNNEQQDGHQHEQVVAEPLTQRHEFTDNISVQVGVQPDGRDQYVVDLADASRIAVVEITVAPAAASRGTPIPAPRWRRSPATS